jgi:hypothetical protein
MAICSLVDEMSLDKMTVDEMTITFYAALKSLNKGKTL